MCESKLIVLEDGKESIVASDVAYLDFNEMIAVRLNGEKISLKGYVIKAIDFINHKIIAVKA